MMISAGYENTQKRLVTGYFQALGCEVRKGGRFCLLKYHLTRFNGVVPGTDNRLYRYADI